MEQVDLYEARTNLSRLVEEASAGAGIVIAQAGRPMTRLVAIEPDEPKRPFGFMNGFERKLDANDFLPLPVTGAHVRAVEACPTSTATPSTARSSPWPFESPCGW